MRFMGVVPVVGVGVVVGIVGWKNAGT